MDRGRLLALAERVLRLEAESIQALVARLDDRFIAAVDLLYRCRGRVIVTGMGKSSHVARKVAATMASTGTPAYFLHPAEGVHGDVGMVAQGDVAMVFSNSGETDELLAVLPAIKRLSVPVVLLTGNAASSLARQADVVVDVGVREEACPMNLAPTSSTTAALAMGDALAMALLDLRGLRAEDYAALHPAGTLGWRALVKVRDLMHSGAAVPMVPESATMKQALEEMTAKRRGMTTVVDTAGRLVGGALLDRLAGDCMSRHPKRIEGDALAAAALAMMEAHQITSLVITDDAGRPAGFIHLHDILSSKIA
jgi:arabinose-5-phosphate isomerase